MAREALPDWQRFYIGRFTCQKEKVSVSQFRLFLMIPPLILQRRIFVRLGGILIAIITGFPAKWESGH